MGPAAGIRTENSMYVNALSLTEIPTDAHLLTNV